jgi:hypothetical protein
VNASLENLARARGLESLEPIGLRTAAYILAIGRVTRIALQRGIWP